MSNEAKKGSGAGEREAGKTREAWQMEDTRTEEVSIPAIRHVGPTLESDPEYLERVGSGEPTPEARIAEEEQTEDPNVRVDPVSGEVLEDNEPEPLKTRLPGDTSSDPHSDVGPDNATTVQRRGERKRNAA